MFKRSSLSLLLIGFCVIIADLAFANDKADQAPVGSSRSIFPSDDKNELNPKVGMTAKLHSIVIPGSELEVKPIDDSQSPIMLRIESVYPHGDAHRYDLTYYGLEPGEYNLLDYLQRKDGSDFSDRSKFLITIHPTLPPGQILPHALQINRSFNLSNYRLLGMAGIAFWIVGLLVILLVKRKTKSQHDSQVNHNMSLADRLRPTIEQAMNGNLSDAEQAELERMLLAYWRKRLNLQDLEMTASITHLKEHPEAGPLFKQLEVWLHQPKSDQEVDVHKLLEPYANLPPDSLESRNDLERTGERSDERSVERTGEKIGSK